MAIPVGEPLLTWNLFVTIILVPISVAVSTRFINKAIDKKDIEKNQKDAEIKKLLEEKEALIAQKEHEKDVALTEWRNQFSAIQCRIKTSVERIEQEIHNKVDWSHCNKRREEVDGVLREMQKIKG